MWSLGSGYLGGDRKSQDVCQIMIVGLWLRGNQLSTQMGQRNKGCMGDTASLMQTVYHGLQDGNTALEIP